ncbi:MAG: hypothetical protein HC896_11735 [Bacteroidales bacterium]|nr:hypothetical protein [Bacteroidales bacterium]
MKATILQHVPYEAPGLIGEWLKAANYEIDTIRLYEQQAMPTIDSFDLLIVMGGPMSATDNKSFTG